MLFKKYDQNSGKVLKRTKPLLVSAAKGYIPPKKTGSDWFLTTTSVWNCDELIGRRIRDWRRLLGETGHDGSRTGAMRKDHNSIYTGTVSVFPAPLVEWCILRYGGEPGGLILDAFAGGPPRAVVSSIMGYRYVGYEIRQEQIDENKRVLSDLGLGNYSYMLGDGTCLDGQDHPTFDFALTCPPYFNLEKYSDLSQDLSNLPSYEEFHIAMGHCAVAHMRAMKPDSFVCIVVGNLRDKLGEMIDFRSDTVTNFKRAGFIFHQDVILSKNFASAAKRACNAWRGMKLVARHEHLLVFRTPNESQINKPFRPEVRQVIGNK